MVSAPLYRRHFRFAMSGRFGSPEETGKVEGPTFRVAGHKIPRH